MGERCYSFVRIRGKRNCCCPIHSIAYSFRTKAFPALYLIGQENQDFSWPTNLRDSGRFWLNDRLINTARGAIISENDLINFLRYRQDVYAILDVTGPEPPMADSGFCAIRYGKCIIVSPYSRFYGTRMQKARPVYGGRTPKICSWHETTSASESGTPCLLHIIEDSSRPSYSYENF